ncbi:hypothetical protein Srot_2632 [Segniliparus rotundus DSM 44985]|uniref:PknH-like extracellular domain-containing protein n=1 Tax=Segniliparus rotundus (strain ATCC BAA-972 / CDC 1076 / CIP 108378 / DSM 44985 / JCM 13578) TaxID=640132 RepID=D6ZC97_SEGRD|nr:hypothetical protein [Segniliparus rotundus]ADG99066.1 hypothetical protein Srot_2632 [Segniliparus rotundus DSM 44985]
MVEQTSPTPWTRRAWVWAVALALIAAAVLGCLRWASMRQAAPTRPQLHVGSLSKLPDADYMKFLPVREDFPKGMQSFLTLSAEELRERPDPPLPTNPPECDPTAPLRSPDLLGEVRTSSIATGRRSQPGYTVGVTREPRDQNFVESLDSWLQSCPQAALPSAANDREIRSRKMALAKLPEPSIGADRSISYSITITDEGPGGADDVLYPTQTHVMTLAVVRGVAMYCLARNSAPQTDAQEREQMLSKWVQRIRSY